MAQSGRCSERVTGGGCLHVKVMLPGQLLLFRETVKPWDGQSLQSQQGPRCQGSRNTGLMYSPRPICQTLARAAPRPWLAPALAQQLGVLGEYWMEEGPLWTKHSARHSNEQEDKILPLRGFASMGQSGQPANKQTRELHLLEVLTEMNCKDLATSGWEKERDSIRKDGRAVSENMTFGPRPEY